MQSVVVCSDVDRDGLAARSADRAVCIGPGPATQSYLRADVVVQAALGTGCDAIHPGYGFLAESPRLAVLAHDHGLVFVGPPPEVMELAGDKLQARTRAVRVGLPVLPGAGVESVEEACAVADGIGYPLVMVNGFAVHLCVALPDSLGVRDDPLLRLPAGSLCGRLRNPSRRARAWLPASHPLAADQPAHRAQRALGS